MAKKSSLGIFERIVGWFSVFLLLTSLFPMVQSQNIVSHPFELMVFGVGYFLFQHFNAKNVLVVAIMIYVGYLYESGVLSFYLTLALAFYFVMYLIDVFNHEVHFRWSIALLATILLATNVYLTKMFKIDYLSAFIVIVGYGIVSFLEWRTQKHPQKISIIIPTYNRAKTIKTTLDSIREQVYTNYEVIIVDDGSTDNTRKVVEKYLSRHKKINGRYIYQDNQDQLNAIKNATQYLTGDAVLILHSDDALYNKYVLRNGFRSLNNGTCDGVFIDLVEVDNEDKKLKKIYTKPYYQSWSAMTKVALGFGRNPYTDTAFWHRDVFETIVTQSYLINNEIAWYDFENHRQLKMKNGNFFGIKYRIHEGNYMNSEDGSVNVLSGELRTFLNLLGQHKIPFYLAQSLWYRALNKIKFSSLMAAISFPGKTNPKNILEFVVSHRVKSIENPYLMAIIGFFKYDAKITKDIKIPKNLRIYHGADIRTFNRDLKNEEVPKFYRELMSDLSAGVKSFNVDPRDEAKFRQILAFFCVESFTQVDEATMPAKKEITSIKNRFALPHFERVVSVISLLLTVFAVIFATTTVDPILKSVLGLIIVGLFPLNVFDLQQHFNAKNILVVAITVLNAFLVDQPLAFLSMTLTSLIFLVNYLWKVYGQNSRNFRPLIVLIEFGILILAFIKFIFDSSSQIVLANIVCEVTLVMAIIINLWTLMAIIKTPRASGKLSIIIPTYNGGDTIIETLRSIAKQTYKNLEVIIVDDESTDNTKEIIENYIERHPSRKITYLRQKNADQLNAIKNGMKKISGDYVYILHSDDVFYNRHVVENGLSQLQDRSVDGVFVDLEQINAKGRKLKNVYTKPFYQSQTNLAKVILNYGRNPYVDFAFWQRATFETVVYESYLTNNMVAWFDFTKFESLNMQNGNFFGIKYRIHEGNYLNSADGTVNVLSGELRIVSHLTSKVQTPSFRIQSIVYRGLNKLKLSSVAPVLSMSGQKTTQEAITETISTRMKPTDHPYIDSINQFFQNRERRLLELQLPDNLKIYDGSDIRLFNRDLKDLTLNEFYFNLMDEMQAGFDAVMVLEQDEAKWQRILEFFCIKNYVKIEVAP